MPTNPRPSEVGWWFRIGRRDFTKKALPTIKSVEEFQAKWIKWWSAAQPKWRDTRSWPFQTDNASGKDWGHLLKGGKDGMYLVVVSLGWWIHAQDSSEESHLDNAIRDVSWVLQNLLRRLSTNATTSKRYLELTETETGRPAEKRARLKE